MYLPSIAWIDATPLEVSLLALNNNQWLDAAAICTDSFKDCDQFTVAIFDLVGCHHGVAWLLLCGRATRQCG